MTNAEKQLAVLAKINESINAAKNCGITEAGRAKALVSEAVEGMILLQKQFISDYRDMTMRVENLQRQVDALETRLASVEGRSHA